MYFFITEFVIVFLVLNATILPVTTIYINSVDRFSSDSYDNKPKDEQRLMRRHFLTNTSITCNDGSIAGFYLRRTTSNKKWIIFLEGGWYCYDYFSCWNRWMKQRHYMTSSKWPETRYMNGILSDNMEENSFWWDANHVFVPYCTSDSWTGTRPSGSGHVFSFLGSLVVENVIKDLLPLGLQNSSDLLLAGSSAGGTGVMLNIDAIQTMLHDELHLHQINVKGISDSGWFLDRAPYSPTLKPIVEVIQEGMQMWQGNVPQSCRQTHKDQPWKCYFGYQLYPTLKSDIFVFQWLFDEAQMDADNVGPPVTKQQWDYIHRMGDELRRSFENVTAVFAPSCISHSILTKHDWRNIKIDGVSIVQALHSWEKKINRKRLKWLRTTREMQNEQPSTGRSAKRHLKSSEKKHRHRNRGRRKDNVFNRKRTQETQKSVSERRTQRSLMLSQRQKNRRNVHKRLERCSWPQCNRSCPRLHNPLTGEEMNLIELLVSFGLDMSSVAQALGVDTDALSNMDYTELLNMLTQPNK